MENRKQITNICLLRKEGLTLFLEKEGDVFTDIKMEIHLYFQKSLLQNVNERKIFLKE